MPSPFLYKKVTCPYKSFISWLLLPCCFFFLVILLLPSLLLLLPWFFFVPYSSLLSFTQQASSSPFIDVFPFSFEVSYSLYHFRFVCALFLLNKMSHRLTICMIHTDCWSEWFIRIYFRMNHTYQQSV